MVLLAFTLVARSVHAQAVRGTVTERNSGAPLSGAFVVLLDSAGVQRNATLTLTNGTYAVRAPHAGRFRVRVELIGHESAASQWLAVVSANAAVADLSLPIAAIEIDALSVVGNRRCVRRPDADGESARLWEEARKALSLTRWTEQERIARFRTRHYDRELRLGSLSVVWEAVRSGYSDSNPYRAVAPDSLAQSGFVRTITGDSTLYYGPDAEVLLSDPFLDTHCFYVTRGKDESRGLAGLAFEPIKGQRLPDIKGALWLDPKTSELKYIEYTYTGIPTGVNVPGVGGRTYFRRLPNGAWIVDRWYIRMAIPRWNRYTGLVAQGLLEGGGQIVDVQTPGSVSSSATVRGTVHDSIHHTPLRRAMVYLSGTSHSTVTDSAGRFAITNVTPGTYVMGLSHASFDSLPAWPPSVEVAIDGKVEEEVAMAVPSMATMIARVCPDARAGAVIAGEVTHGGHAQGDVTVTAAYRDNGVRKNVHAKSNASGHYLLCGLPTRTSIAIGVNDQEPAQVRISRTQFLRVDLEVK